MTQITKKEYQKYSVEMLMNIIADELNINVDKLTDSSISSVIDIIDDLRSIYTNKNEKYNRFDFLGFAESSGYSDNHNDIIMALFDMIDDAED